MFSQYETFAVQFDPGVDGADLGGGNYLLQTPDDFEPPIWFYLTCVGTTVAFQMAHVPRL